MRWSLLAVMLAACGTESTTAAVDAAVDAGLQDPDARRFDAAVLPTPDARRVDAPPGAPDAQVGGTADAAPLACSTPTVGATLGRDRLMLGGTMDDATFNSRPFDLRYVYLAGDVPAATGCSDCRTCTIAGKSCANNAGGCAWWGCWQYDADPPGRYVVDFIHNARNHGAVPMITYYIWLTVSGGIETVAEMDALADGAKVKRYLADWRFLCARVAEASSEPVILHVEPDLWGYGQQRKGNDPTSLSVALSAAADPACAGLPDHFGGFARCLVAIADSVAPNALVALHVSPWAAQFDAFVDNGPSFDLLGHADRTAAYVNALAVPTPLFVLDMTDRDAGFNLRWWDASDATRPNFANPIAWAKRVSQKLGQPFLWWQVPYGHLGNTVACVDGVGAYEDNRLDYFFDHPDRFAAGGALGIAFGAGASCMTTPSTDGGHFAARAQSYFAGTRPALSCP